MLYQSFSALQQNRAQPSLLYLFYDKESKYLSTLSEELSNQRFLFFQRSKSGVNRALFSDKSQSLEDLLNWFDWLTGRQLSIRNWTSAKLSVSRGVREKNDAFRILRHVMVSSPEKSGHVVAIFHWKLWIKEVKACRWKCEIAELSLEGATVMTLGSRLQQDCPKLASKLERLDCSHWAQERIS